MTEAVPRPDPADADTAAFWDGIANGELRLQRSAACDTFRHPPQPVCAACGSDERIWVASPGRGVVWSYTVIYPPTLPAFADRTPYGAVVVGLDEGVFMVSNLVECPVDELAVGARVEIAYTEVEPGLWLPLFRPAP